MRHSPRSDEAVPRSKLSPRCALRLATLRQPRPPACYAKYLVRSVGKLSEFGFIGLGDWWIGGLG
jgi:hypothetical protein